MQGASVIHWTLVDGGYLEHLRRFGTAEVAAEYHVGLAVYHEAQSQS